MVSDIVTGMHKTVGNGTFLWPYVSNYKREPMVKSTKATYCPNENPMRPCTNTILSLALAHACVPTAVSVFRAYSSNSVLCSRLRFSFSFFVALAMYHCHMTFGGKLMHLVRSYYLM